MWFHFHSILKQMLSDQLSSKSLPQLGIFKLTQQFSVLLLLMFAAWLQLAFLLKTFTEILLEVWHHLMVLLALSSRPASHENWTDFCVYRMTVVPDVIVSCILSVLGYSGFVPACSYLVSYTDSEKSHLFWSFCLTFLCLQSLESFQLWQVVSSCLPYPSAALDQFSLVSLLTFPIVLMLFILIK